MRGLFATIASVTLCFVPAGPALADTIVFSGSGFVTATGPPDAGFNLPQAVIEPTAYDFGDGLIWHISAAFSFNIPTGVGSGTFSFTSGGNSLSGDVTTHQDSTDPSKFALSYVVTSGTGIFAGETGTGSSTVQLLAPPSDPPKPIAFIENGSFAVPEPGSLVMIGLGLAGIVVSRRASKPGRS